MVSTNLDCMKQIMLIAKEKLEIIDGAVCPVNWQYIYSDFRLVNTYSKDTVKYNIIKLKELGFIIVAQTTLRSTDSLQICDITVKGHEFITRAMNYKIWEQAKGRAEAIGGCSIIAFITIVDRIAVEQATKRLHGV